MVFFQYILIFFLSFFLVKIQCSKIAEMYTILQVVTAKLEEKLDMHSDRSLDSIRA